MKQLNLNKQFFKQFYDKYKVVIIIMIIVIPFLLIYTSEERRTTENKINELNKEYDEWVENTYNNLYEISYCDTWYFDVPQKSGSCKIACSDVCELNNYNEYKAEGYYAQGLCDCFCKGCINE